MLIEIYQDILLCVTEFCCRMSRSVKAKFTLHDFKPGCHLANTFVWRSPRHSHEARKPQTTPRFPITKQQVVWWEQSSNLTILTKSCSLNLALVSTPHARGQDLHINKGFPNIHRQESLWKSAPNLITTVIS